MLLLMILERNIIVNTDVLYPNIEVSLVGEDGNAFAILGRVRKAMRRGNVPANEITKFHDEATSGDYDHLLRTCLKYVTVDRDDEDEDE